MGHNHTDSIDDLATSVLAGLPLDKQLIAHFAASGSSEDQIIDFLNSNSVYIPIDGVSYRFIPGHKLNAPPGVYGPVKSRLMIVGKYPAYYENLSGRLFSGPTGTVLFRTLLNYGFNLDEIYLTNICRFYPEKLTERHIKICQPLLLREIEQVDPEFIWIMGAEAVKVFFGHASKLKDYRFTAHKRCGKAILSTSHAAEVIHSPDKVVDFEASARFVKGYMDGNRFKEVKYVVVDSLEDVRKAVDLLKQFKLFYIDSEWAGRNHKTNKIRLLQISVDHSYSIVFKFFANEGNGYEQKIDPKSAGKILSEALKGDNVAVVGHNLKADMHTIHKHLGIDLVDEYLRGGDTMLLDHVLFPTRGHSLDDCVLRYTPLGNYSANLHKWRKERGKVGGLEDELGYGDIPDDILVPYAATDTIATAYVYEYLSEAIKLKPTLEKLYREIELPASIALYNCEERGILFDRDRALSFVEKFRTKADELYNDLDRFVKEKLQSADTQERDRLVSILLGKEGEFNPRSVKRVRCLLFDSAMLGLTPIQTSGKKAIPWDELDEDNIDMRLEKASTGDVTLRLLASKHPIVRTLVDYRVTYKVMSGMLKQTDEYKKGSLFCHVDPDGAIRSTILQLAETGRYTSSRPNMQNNPKKREADYERIFGEKVILRSVFRARDGYKLVEADYKQAELRVLAWLSGDEAFWRDLSERDLHSVRAKDMFNLSYSLEEIKHDHKDLRIAAKTVNFGIPYGRGAKAIAIEVMKNGGPDCNAATARQWIDGFFDTYQVVAQFIEGCKRCVHQGFITTPFGRWREFYLVGADEAQIRKFEREAVNFPIQGTVADVLAKAQNNFIQIKKYLGDDTIYYQLLPIHDAILLEVRNDMVDFVVNEVIPEAMTRQVVIPGINKSLETDIEVFESHWGV